MKIEKNSQRKFEHQEEINNFNAEISLLRLIKISDFLNKKDIDIIKENNNNIDNINGSKNHNFDDDVSLSIKNRKIYLPENVVKELENPNLCEICFSSDLTVDTAVKFQCKHIFCLICVKTYLEKNIENGKVKFFNLLGS